MEVGKTYLLYLKSGTVVAGTVTGLDKEGVPYLDVTTSFAYDRETWWNCRQMKWDEPIVLCSSINDITSYEEVPVNGWDALKTMIESIRKPRYRSDKDGSDT